jgi:hypothetical protein
MSKKYLNVKDGFYRFKNRIEINWSIYEWALPLGLYLGHGLIEIRFLCVSVFIPQK